MLSAVRFCSTRKKSISQSSFKVLTQAVHGEGLSTDGKSGSQTGKARSQADREEVEVDGRSGMQKMGRYRQRGCL